MNSATVERLLELNREFYAQRGRDFSETRRRVQPGIQRIIETIAGDETVLDLGCGNGTFAKALSRAGHRGRYLGIDASTPLLEIARGANYDFPVDFLQVDLVGPPAPLDGLVLGADRHPEDGKHGSSTVNGGWSTVTAFAVLHHIPGNDLRASLLRRARELLCPDGRLALSNWQFTSSPRLRERIQPWSRVGNGLDLESGDYLLDWRRSQYGLRYVHEFNEAELRRLAAECGYVVAETFYSDGADHKSGLYQLWRAA